jgi:hypothetical protein
MLYGTPIILWVQYNLNRMVSDYTYFLKVRILYNFGALIYIPSEIRGLAKLNKVAIKDLWFFIII